MNSQITSSNSQSWRLDSSVVGRLREVVRRLRRYVFIEGVAWIVVTLVALALIQFAIDYWTRGLQWSMRAALLGLTLACGAWVAALRVWRPLRLKIGLADAAKLVERRFPELSSVLVSAVRFDQDEVGLPISNSPSLIASVVDRARIATASIDFLVVVNPSRARRSAAVLMGVVAMATCATIVSPEMVGMWFSRNVLLHNIEWPKRTRLVVELTDGELIGARGDDLVVQALAEGIQPREVGIRYETLSGQTGRESMVSIGNIGSYRYRHTFQRPKESFRFQLFGGDDRTKWYEARLIDRPRVVQSSMEIVPPAYSGLNPVTFGEDRRSAQVLPGTTVTFRALMNKPVSKVSFVSNEEEVGEISQEGDYYVANVTLMKSATYQFLLVDEVGFENRRPVQFALRVMKDDAPLVRLRLPGVGDMVTPQAILPMELEFSDTYGLATANLLYQEGEESEKPIPFDGFELRATHLETSLSWPVSTVELEAGDRVSLMARASDFDDVSGPNLAESTQVVIRVVSKDEFLAEISRREQEYRMDFERLVDNQERLRGELLTAMRKHREKPDLEWLGSTLTPLERRQRSIISSINVIRQQFERVLAELRVNQLDTDEERERLQIRIIDPLTEIARRDLADAADTIRQWSRDGTAETASAVDQKQYEALARMRAVLSVMIQWEGYHELVTMLRDIVRLQSELSTETKDALEKEVGDIFED